MVMVNSDLILEQIYSALIFSQEEMMIHNEIYISLNVEMKIIKFTSH